jgi:hypothetical protein
MDSSSGVVAVGGAQSGAGLRQPALVVISRQPWSRQNCMAGPRNTGTHWVTTRRTWAADWAPTTRPAVRACHSPCRRHRGRRPRRDSPVVVWKFRPAVPETTDEIGWSQATLLSVCPRARRRRRTEARCRLRQRVWCQSVRSSGSAGGRTSSQAPHSGGRRGALPAGVARTASPRELQGPRRGSRPERDGKRGMQLRDQRGAVPEASARRGDPAGSMPSARARRRSPARGR